jgi:beta-1,4-mannosyltransferase
MRTTRILRDEESLLEAAADVALQLESRGYRLDGDAGPTATLLAYTPPARTNPFQSLLYSRSIHHGVACVPVKRVFGLADVPWPGRMVCHLHWLSNVLAGIETDGEADDAIARVVAELDAVRARGHRIVWTAHNVLPHDTRHEVHEIALRRAVIDAADAIHVMTDQTVRLFDEYVPLPPEKVFSVPHPTYAGAYPDFVSRDEARSELSAGADDVVFLLFGSLQPYKGVEELLDAFQVLAARPLSRRVRLVVAGHAPEQAFGNALRVWAAQRDDVTFEISRIPSEEVQYFYRAADVAVLPYRRGLNSGAAMLAVTFGVPVLVPERGGLAELAATPGFIPYRADEESGLVDAMARLVDTDLAPLRSQVARVAAAATPHAVSDAFFTKLLGLLGHLRRSEAAA